MTSVWLFAIGGHVTFFFALESQELNKKIIKNLLKLEILPFDKCLVIRIPKPCGHPCTKKIGKKLYLKENIDEIFFQSITRS